MTKKFIPVFMMLLLLFACSTQNEEDILKSAQENIQKKNYDEALADFEVLVKDFPEGKDAGKAHFEMAKLYQGEVISGLSKEESMNKAIEHYKIVYTEYPEMTEAPGALFMTGFIQANELGQNDKAEETYKLFLQKYPDSELATSAKAELENLGLSPEEILMKNMAKQE